MICVYGPADANVTRSISCSSKIQNGFLVPAYLGCPGKKTVKLMYRPSSSLYLSTGIAY